MRRTFSCLQLCPSNQVGEGGGSYLPCSSALSGLPAKRLGGHLQVVVPEAAPPWLHRRRCPLCCSAVLGTAAGRDKRAPPCRAAVPLSEDHKPNRIDERQRIESAGGVVVWAGTWRVGGVLAVSRAFGDRLLKRYVVAMPDITEQVRTASQLVPWSGAVRKTCMWKPGGLSQCPARSLQACFLAGGLSNGGPVPDRHFQVSVDSVTHGGSIDPG